MGCTQSSAAKPQDGAPQSILSAPSPAKPVEVSPQVEVTSAVADTRDNAPKADAEADASHAAAIRAEAAEPPAAEDAAQVETINAEAKESIEDARSAEPVEAPKPEEQQDSTIDTEPPA